MPCKNCTSYSNSVHPFNPVHSFVFLSSVTRGLARNLLRGDKTGGLGTEERKSPSGVQGQSAGGGLGAKPPEARDKC